MPSGVCVFAVLKAMLVPWEVSRNDASAKGNSRKLEIGVEGENLRKNPSPVAMCYHRNCLNIFQGEDACDLLFYAVHRSAAKPGEREKKANEVEVSIAKGNNFKIFSE